MNNKLLKPLPDFLGKLPSTEYILSEVNCGKCNCLVEKRVEEISDQIEYVSVSYYVRNKIDIYSLCACLQDLDYDHNEDDLNYIVEHPEAYDISDENIKIINDLKKEFLEKSPVFRYVDKVCTIVTKGYHDSWIFACNYNVLRIMSGMGGISYGQESREINSAVVDNSVRIICESCFPKNDPMYKFGYKYNSIGIKSN